MNPSFKEIYKILINFFRKKRKRPSGLFSESMVKLFNSLVNKLQKVIIGKNIYEKYTPTFSEFTGLLSEEFNFNYMRSSSVQSKYDMHKKRKPVNIIVDYFQPINNSHIATAETLKNKNKLPTLLILIDNAERSPIKPFKTETAERLVSKYLASAGDDAIINYVVIKRNNIDSILKSICNEYIPVLWASNKSKINEYILQMEYARKRNTKYNVSKRFKLIIAPELNQNRILDYIATSNYQSFSEHVPKSICPEFYNLKKEIDAVNSSLQ